LFHPVPVLRPLQLTWIPFRIFFNNSCILSIHLIHIFFPCLYCSMFLTFIS
jgi:hypothetical protein